MSDITQKLRWLEHVALNRGAAESRARSENLNYRGRVLFSGSWPIARLIQAADGENFVCISRNNEQMEAPTAWRLHGQPQIVANIRVPCVGVYTWVPGDGVAEGQELNDRLHKLWLTMADDIVRLARNMTTHRMFTARGWRRGKKVEAQVEMAEIAKAYGLYAGHVAGYWEPFGEATEYAMTRLDDIVESMEQRYFSDKEVAKRDRETAKREARKALQV